VRFCISIAPVLMIEGVTRMIILNYVIFSSLSMVILLMLICRVRLIDFCIILSHVHVLIVVDDI
jgi:hypothetical protein